jgi:putative transcriptional regulator
LTIRHHPQDETLLAYAAGTQVTALAAVIACHLACCPRCRAEVRRMERIAGALLERAAEQELSRGAMERTLARLPQVAPEVEPKTKAGGVREQTDGVLPPPLSRHLGMGIDDIPWKELARGVEQFKIKMPRNGGDLRLLRVQAGKKLLRHGHYGSELTLVLKGAYHDETGEFRAGEVADLDEDIEHRPKVTDDGECICIIAGESHPRYKSLKVRLLRPFLGL